MRSVVLGLLAVALSGCGASYAYVPTEEASANAAGPPAARYGVPPEAPHGDVRVSTTGVENVRLASGDQVRTLHVRLTVSNDNGAAAWTMDTRDVLLDLAKTGERRASFVRGTPSGSSVLAVAPGDARSVDLYYVLPREEKSEKRIPRFDVLWQVQTAERVVAERTPFERVTLEPPVSTDVGAGFGIGPFGYFEPYPPFPPIVEHEVHVAPPAPRYLGFPR